SGGRHPVGLDEHLDEGAAGARWILLTPRRIHGGDRARQRQCSVAALERQDVRLVERGGPALAKAEGDGRREGRGLVGTSAEAAWKTEDRLAQVTERSGLPGRGLRGTRGRCRPRRRCGGRRGARRRTWRRRR